MARLDARLQRIEQQFRCVRHRTPLVCRCEMPANPWTPTEAAEFGRIIENLRLRYDMMTPAPVCPRCRRARYCVECQKSNLRLADVLARLSPEDQTCLVELLEKGAHAKP